VGIEEQKSLAKKFKKYKGLVAHVIDMETRIKVITYLVAQIHNANHRTRNSPSKAIRINKRT